MLNPSRLGVRRPGRCRSVPRDDIGGRLRCVRVIARRAGDTWYLAGINGEPVEKHLELDLSFLSEREGDLITDGEPRQFARHTVKSGATTPVSAKANGGFVMTFKPNSGNQF